MKTITTQCGNKKGRENVTSKTPNRIYCYHWRDLGEDDKRRPWFRPSGM